MELLIEDEILMKTVASATKMTLSTQNRKKKRKKYSVDEVALSKVTIGDIKFATKMKLNDPEHVGCFQEIQ